MSSLSPSVAGEEEPVVVEEQRARHWASPPLSPLTSSASPASATTHASTSASTFSFRPLPRPLPSLVPASSSSTPSLSPSAAAGQLPPPSPLPPTPLSPSSPPLRQPKGRSVLPLLSVGRSLGVESPQSTTVSASSAASVASTSSSLYSSHPLSSSSNGSRSPRTSPHSPTTASPAPATTPLSSSSASTASGAALPPPLSPQSVADLVAANARLAAENAAMKEVLSRHSSRRPSLEGRQPLGEAEEEAAVAEEARRLFPFIASALPAPSSNLSLSAPSASSKALEEEDEDEEEEEAQQKAERERDRRRRARAQQGRYQTLGGGGLTRRINDLRGEVLQALPPALLAPPSPLPPLPLASGSRSPADGPVVDRTRSLPLRAVRAQRKTAPADLSLMMEHWRQLQATGRDPLHELDKAATVAGRGGGGGVEVAAKGSRVSSPADSSGSSSEEEQPPTGPGRQRRAEAKEQGRRQSWARGAATMNHAEVRLMMDMMRQAKQSKDAPPLRSEAAPPPQTAQPPPAADSAASAAP